MSRLVGLVHLGPLPGSPRFDKSLDRVVEAALADADALAKAGFDAVVVENFGDAPFFADRVPEETIAAMSVAVRHVVTESSLPVGVNVLRNDGVAAMAIAHATGAGFIRVNVYTGAMITDQGPITGRAAEITRRRAGLGAGVEIWADVMVKHAVPPVGLTLEDAAADAIGRGMADRIIVSGRATGAGVDRDTLRRAKSTAGDTPVMVGSGATADDVARLLEIADGVIVGTALKRDGITTNPVDPALAAAFVAAAG